MQVLPELDNKLTQNQYLIYMLIYFSIFELVPILLEFIIYANSPQISYDVYHRQAIK